MLENQFIQFGTIKPQDNEIAMPTISGIQTTFFVDNNNKDIAGIDMVTPDGMLIKEKAVNATEGWCDLYDLTMLAPMECYRLRINKKDGTYLYSNLLRCVLQDAQYAVVKYYCYEEAFGFPFSGAKRFIQQLLPIHLHSPQFKQSDKIYEKLSGEQVVLYATISREYEAETDYIPEAWHKKIIAALSCDRVYINGERYTKSGSYDIDWDKSECDTKLAKATFKVSDNIMQRNSNY
jgi:hypothetical protein